MKRLAAPFRLIVQYLQGAFKEFRQVTWPTREQVVRYTILVTCSIIVGVLILSAFDYGLRQLTQRYLFS